MKKYKVYLEVEIALKSKNVFLNLIALMSEVFITVHYRLLTIDELCSKECALLQPTYRKN